MVPWRCTLGNDRSLQCGRISIRCALQMLLLLCSAESPHALVGVDAFSYLVVGDVVWAYHGIMLILKLENLLTFFERHDGGERV